MQAKTRRALDGLVDADMGHGTGGLAYAAAGAYNRGRTPNYPWGCARTWNSSKESGKLKSYCKETEAELVPTLCRDS